MNLRDCSVTLTSNIKAGFSSANQSEEILKQIFAEAKVDYATSWEFGSDFVRHLKKEGYCIDKVFTTPEWCVTVVGGYGVCFTVVTISGLFNECTKNDILIDV